MYVVRFALPFGRLGVACEAHTPRGRRGVVGSPERL